MKKGWIDQVFANVSLQWCQGRSISLRCQHLVGEDIWERLCKKIILDLCYLHPMVPYKQWGEGTRQGEAAPPPPPLLKKASMDSCNEWREMLHRWSSEERMTCREGGNTATGERLGHRWSKHFCYRGGLPLKIQLFKHYSFAVFLSCQFKVKKLTQGCFRWYFFSMKEWVHSITVLMAFKTAKSKSVT